MKFQNTTVPFTLCIGLVLFFAATAIAEIQIPNPGFEDDEEFAPANWAGQDKESCVSNLGNTVTRPLDWMSWYDNWCDAADQSYCKPCGDYMLCESNNVESYTGSKSMRLGAANRIGWFEGTAITYIKHDGGKLPNKLSGYYKKDGDAKFSYSDYLDPQVFLLHKDIDMPNFEQCMQGMLTGCNLEDDNHVMVSVLRPPNPSEDDVSLGATDEWTYWEREIPGLPQSDAANVGWVVIRFRHMAGGVTKYAYVDDLEFSFPADEPKEGKDPQDNPDGNPGDNNDDSKDDLATTADEVDDQADDEGTSAAGGCTMTGKAPSATVDFLVSLLSLIFS